MYKLLQIAYTLYHQYSVECAAEHTPLPLYDEGLIPQSTTDQVDEDLQKLTDAPEHCTSWMELCMTSACTLLVKALMKVNRMFTHLYLYINEKLLFIG
ncbi:hypothetical protein EON65_17710 [archaeon]|nr:MAG: hypothetical protein EON65_17710 [archaeon]